MDHSIFNLALACLIVSACGSTWAFFVVATYRRQRVAAVDRLQFELDATLAQLRKGRAAC